MTGVLIKTGNLEGDRQTDRQTDTHTHTHTHTHTGSTLCEDEGRDQGDTCTSQGKSKTARKAPEAGGEGWNRCFPSA